MCFLSARTRVSAVFDAAAHQTVTSARQRGPHHRANSAARLDVRRVLRAIVTPLVGLHTGSRGTRTNA